MIAMHCPRPYLVQSMLLSCHVLSTGILSSHAFVDILEC